MERSRITNHAGAYKKQKDGGIDKRALRAHRRSIDQRNIRDQQLMGRRKIDDMSPLKEVDLNVSQDHQEQAPAAALSKPGAVKPDRREMLLKWKQEKELKQKLAAREKAKNRTFKVCHVKYDPTPTWSAEEDNKKTKPKQPAGPMRASARLAARTETKPKPDAPVGRVTRSRAASTNQKAAAEPPKRTTRQRVPSGTAAGKKEVPARQTRKRATSTKETEPKPAPVKKRAASAKQAEPTRVTRARAKSEAQGQTVPNKPAAGHKTVDDGLDDDLQPVNFDFSLSKVNTVSNQRGEPQESNPAPSFAPTDFSFHAPSHLPSFSFTPLSPRSADAFLFPGSGAGGSFLNSPYVSKNNRHSTPKSVTRRNKRTSKLARAEEGEAAPVTTATEQPTNEVTSSENQTNEEPEPVAMATETLANEEAAPIPMAAEQPTNEVPSSENQTNEEPEPVAMATETLAKEESAPIPMATEETANEDTTSEQPIMPEPAPIAMETEKEANESPAVEEPANEEPVLPDETDPKEAEKIEAPLEEPMQEAQDVTEAVSSSETLQDAGQVHQMEASQDAVQETSHDAPAADPSVQSHEMEASHDAVQETGPSADAPEQVVPSLPEVGPNAAAMEDVLPEVAPDAAAVEDVLPVGDANQLIQPADDIVQGPKDGAEAHDVPYFRWLLVSQAEHLTGLCTKWEDTVTQDGLSEEVQGQIRTTIGQAQLLMDQRFKQFSGLVDNCEFNTGEKETTCQDLQGFWDMVYFQVEDVDKKFDDLEKLKARNWEPEEVKKPVKIKKKIVKKPVKKPAGKDGKDREAARKRLMEAKAAMKAAMMANKEQKEQKEEAKVTEDTVTFDGGFFKVNSPAKTPQFHCRAGTPLKALNPMSEERRLSRTMDPQMRRRSTRLTPKPVSQLIQALTHTPGNKQSPVAMETMNNTPSSAGLRRSGRLTPQPMAALIPEDTPVAMGTTELAVVGTPVKLHSPIGEGSEFTEDAVTEESLDDGTVAITTEMVVVGTPVKLHSPIGEGSEFREDGVTEEFLEDGTVAITTEIPEQGEERKQSFSMFLMPTSSVADNSGTNTLEPMETELTNTSDTEMHSPMKRNLTTMFDQEGQAKVKTPARRVARRSVVNFVSPPEEGCLAKPLPKTPAPSLFKTRPATEELPMFSPLTATVPDKPACATPATLLASLNMNHSRQEDTMDIGFTPPDQNPIRGTEGGVRTYRSSLSSDEEEEDPTINLMGFSPDPPIKVKKQSSSEDEETAGTAVRFAAITPSKKMRDYMGTDVVMSPVRRSMRLESAGAVNPPQTVVRNLHDLPEDVDYGYQPNKSVL